MSKGSRKASLFLLSAAVQLDDIFLYSRRCSTIYDRLLCYDTVRLSDKEGSIKRYKEEVNMMQYHEARLERAKRAIEKVARRNGVTVEEVRREISLAILMAQPKADRWQEIPCAGSVPTPKELIAYCAEHSVR